MSEQGASYFLSYSRSDQQFALRFATDLRNEGVAIWVDQLDIRPSEHWDRAIERAVRDCRGMLVILSPRSVASDNVADEISFAIDSGKSVLPVVIERCILPLRITRMQVIDAIDDYDRALQQCLAELRRDPEAPRPSAPEPRAKAPARPAKSISESDVEPIAKALTRYLGPIAPILAKRESASSPSLDDLRQRLAEHIPRERDRAEFLRTVRTSPFTAS